MNCQTCGLYYAYKQPGYPELTICRACDPEQLNQQEAMKTLIAKFWPPGDPFRKVIAKRARADYPYKTRIPPGLRRTVYDRDQHQCRECGTTTELTIDHVWPEALGGSLHVTNLQTLCRPCNCRKGTALD